MADRKLSGLPPTSLSSCSHQNGLIGGAAVKHHQNGGLDSGPGPHHPCNSVTPSSRTPASTSPLRTLRSLVSPEGSSSSTRTRSPSSRTRTTSTSSRHSNSQHEEPDAMLDLILESQGQRLNDQRASLSLLPDPGPTALCGSCSHNQPLLPSLDFYCMLIRFQSDRMEDQRCHLPDLDDVAGSVPEGQEDFFSLIQRVQSRRMDEQRALLLITDDDDDEAHTTGTSPTHQHRHHHH